MAVAENTGYPVGWFKNQDIAKDFYECVICLEVVKDAVQLRDCGHLFCRYCIDNVLKVQAQCPTCRINISEEMIFPDKNANRAIGKLEVNCASTGCEWDGTLNSLLQEHNASCPFFILNCNNVGCDMQVIRQEFEVHLTKCEHRIVVCEHCKSEHVFKDKDEHLSTCLFLPVECENKCSENNIPRNEMKEHLDTVCSKTVIKCKYSEFDCEYECERQEIEEHLNQAMKEHLELSTSRLKEKLENDENEMEEWKIKHENDINELTSKHENDINELTSKYENDIKELKVMHQEDITQLRQQIDQILMGTNCSGTFMMTIFDIESRLSLARTTIFGNEVISAPFFTSSFGYKMRLHIFLDQRANGFTGHMGAYLHLMRSNHDEILHWPFNKRYIFRVIDQQDQQYRKDHVRMIVPQGESMFNRPQQNENSQGFGFTSFISHANLRTRNYIKNHSVRIAVQIEL